MASRAELLAEAQRRGLNVGPAQEELRAEAERRGLTVPQVASAQAQPEGPGVFEQFGAGLSRGAQTIGRGLGLLEPETPEARAQFEALGDDFFAASAGEIVGEALPFIPLAAIGPAVGVTSFIGRALVGTGIGALEGGVITRGKGAVEEEIAIGAGIGGAIGGTAEALLPSFGRLVSRVFKKLGRSPKGQLITEGGTPTPEFQDALDKTGTNFDDLTRESVETLSRAAPGTVAEQAARKARFEAQRIPATTGDITQELAEQAGEQRTLAMATGEAGEPLRQLKLQQSEAFKREVTSLVDSLGVPDKAGESLKSALTGRKKLLTKEKNALYKEVADAAPEAANFPIVTDTIEAALPDARTLRRLGRIAGSQIEGVKDLLVDAVGKRLVADVPVGSFLSGGVDSSLISAIVAQDKKDFETFSIGFNDRSYDEVEYSKLASRHIATKHHVEYLDVDEDLIEYVISRMDEPFGDSSVLPTYLLSKMTRKNVTVSLSGDAGDEVFGGYDTYQAYNIARFTPKAIAQLARPIVGMLPPSDKKLSLTFKMKKFIDGFQDDVNRRHLDWMSSFADVQRRQLLGDNFRQADSFIDTGKGGDLLSVQLNDIRNYMAEDILKKVDFASMLNSLEVRVPFLDHRLVPTVLSLPEKYKIRFFRTKWFLKRIASDYLPAEIVHRKKRGFTVPISRWIKKSDLIREYLTGDRYFDHDLLDRRYVGRLLSDHLDNKADNARLLWLVFTFNKWYTSTRN